MEVKRMIARYIKTHYSETEAALDLGMPVEQLRQLIRKHIASSEEELANVPRTYFQPSDLLLLRLLARQEATAQSLPHR
jgi:hypothetical protein